MNIVYHDRVLPPLNKDRDIANFKDDKTWQVIPVAFADPITRHSGSGQVLTYDAHVHSAVVNKMKESAANFQTILHYLVQKFQAHVKDKFYPLHKRSLKLIKRKYKHGKGGTSNIVPPYVLPPQHDIQKFKEVKEKIKVA